MARDFDFVDDKIDYGSDTSIDDFVTQTISLWFVREVAGVNPVLVNKSTIINAWGLRSLSTDFIQLAWDWTVSNGTWRTNNAVSINDMHHLVVTYDNSSALNDPVFYVDGVAVAITETAVPAGVAALDAGFNLLMGLNAAAGGDWDGQMGWFCYANAIWTAEQANRAKWWGTPGGAFAVYHPLVTDSLVNKGTATADGSATGTTVASLPRVERNWGSMMGCGR